MERIFIGVDLGTSAVKVLAVTAAGTRVAFGAESYGLVTPAPLHVEQDIESVYAATLRVVTGVIRNARERGEIASVGFSSAMHGAIAYGCTAGTMTTPLERLPRLIKLATGVPGVTTASAVVDALRTFGAKTVAIAAPYHDAMIAREAAFLRRLNFRVVATRGLDIGARGPDDFVRLRTVPPALVYAHARATVIDGTEALFLACTDMATYDIVDALEADLGIPVVTSNQATLWATLRAARVRVAIPGWGRLLATH